MKVFQYGSNTDLGHLIERLSEESGLSQAQVKSKVKSFGLATTKGKLVFNVYSKNRECLASDLDTTANNKAYGVLIDLDDTLVKALEDIEGVKYGKYKQQNIVVNNNGLEQVVKTYTVTDKAKQKTQTQHPGETTSINYVKTILKGLTELGAPKDYLEKIAKESTLKYKKIEDKLAFEYKTGPVYQAKKAQKSNEIGMSEKMRDKLKVKIGDTIWVENGDQKVKMKVTYAPKELALGPGKDPEAICLNKKARELLGLEETGTRNTQSFAKQYTGVKLYV